MGDVFVSAKKFSKTTIAIRFDLLQVSPSVPPFEFATLLRKFIPSFNVLSGYFYVSLNFVTVSHV